MFQFPNWSIELPGRSYIGSEPDGFAHKDEVLRFIEDYCAFIRAPIRTGVNVTKLRAQSSGKLYEIVTGSANILARNVVVATGPHQNPRFPSLRRSLAASVTQIHACEYRNPSALPEGAVLVVGSGASGCQIADELLEAGRTVYFSVGGHRRVPRRYRGRDVFWWRRELGELDQTEEATPVARRRPPLVTGAHGGYDIDLRQSAARGMILLGHLIDDFDGTMFFAPDLQRSLDAADQHLIAFKNAVDIYLQKTGLEAPLACDDGLVAGNRGTLKIHEQIDLKASRISAVIWATGYSYDFGWVELPVFDSRGLPAQYRGVTSLPGIYFLGLQWLHKAKSSFLYGVGEDAGYIASRIASAD